MMLFTALIVSVLFANTLPCHAVEIAGEPLDQTRQARRYGGTPPFPETV